MTTLAARAGAVREAAGAAPEVLCAHCSLPVPAGLVRVGAAEQFCCHGCETARAVIVGCGLDKYYALRDAAGDTTPASGTSRLYEEFDDPAFESLYVRTPSAGVRRADLFLSGVHCSACVWLVERLPRLVPGVSEARLDLRRAIVSVTWDPSVVRLSRVARVLDSIGYAPHPARDAVGRASRRAEDRRQLIRLAVAGACAGNVMILALALYAGIFDWMDPAHAQLFRWVSMPLTLVALVWPGAVFFRSAWAAVRTRTPHLDVPIAIALAAGGVWSVVSTLRGHGEIYFDTVSVLVFALLVGRFLQSRQQRYAADAVELLFSLTPSSARRVEGDGAARVVSIESIRPGDVLEVAPGETAPADGVVVAGESSLDESLLTGESLPVRACPGREVAAGAVNLSGPLRVEVRATGEATRIARLMRLVSEASSRRAPIQRFADRASAWFVVGMLGAALATLAAWLFIDPAHALEHAVALLVVTCPCAVGLATPLTMSIALGRAARAGMLIKGGDAIQRLSDAAGAGATILLDKTGTLTGGRLAVVEWTGDAWLKPLVAAAEARCAHPIAAALARDLVALPAGVSASEAPDAPMVEELRHTTGGGIEAVVDGRRLIVGSPAFVASLAGPAPRDLAAAAERAAGLGLTPVVIAADGRTVALAALGDAPRPDSPDAVRRLREAGFRPRILSGDHPSVVASVAASLGIEPEWARGGASPEEKLHAVERAGEEGRVLMVGDGVNDAAALAAADVGIAVHGGAEASLAAADVYLSRPGLSGVLDLIDGSTRTLRVIRMTLWASLGYNVVAGALAAAGLITPILAAIVMPISSLTAVAIALRSRTFEKPGQARDAGVPRVGAATSREVP